MNQRPDSDSTFDRGREAANLAIGGILGAYLGFAISKNGLSTGSQWDLASLIFMVAMFALLMNEMPSFFRDGFSWKRMMVFFNLSAGTSVFAYLSAGNLGIDVYVLRTIFFTWAFLIACETILFFHRYRKTTKK